MTSVAVSRWEEQEMVNTLRQTVCKGATEPQFRMFVEICKATGLNPLLREIWFVPGVGIIAARDGYLRVANEHPQFDGMETRVERDEKKVPIKAVCTVWRKDRAHPTVTEAYFSEYKKSSGVWTSYPSAMISKVAEVLALKRSFSINGVVSEEEMGPAAAYPIAQDQPGTVTIPLAIEGPAQVVEVVEPEDPTPPKLQAMYDQIGMPGDFDKLKPFQAMKADLKDLMGDVVGEEVYYEVLGRFKKKDGSPVLKSNQFKNKLDAKCAARDLFLAVQKAVASREV